MAIIPKKTRLSEKYITEMIKCKVEEKQHIYRILKKKK